MTPKEERSIARKMRRGSRQARAEFIRRNMRLVFVCAKRLVWLPLTLEERVASGYEGLIIAVDKFDPSRGFRFGTMAGWWIRATIVREANDKGRLVRLPARLSEGKKAKPVDGIDAGDFAVTSLDRERWVDGTSGEFTLHDILASDAPAPDARLYEAERREGAMRMLDGLTARERLVLEYRHGFRGEEQTLQEIGAMWGLSRERIRQIEAGALAKIRKRVDTGVLEKP
jgi:RNA polymerase primary sigma factor